MPAQGINPNIQGGPSKVYPKKPQISGGPTKVDPRKPAAKKRLGGGRWRKNAAGQGGRGSMGQRAGGRGQGQGGAPGRPGGGKRPGRQGIHAQRQADRRAGVRPRMGRQEGMQTMGQMQPGFQDVNWGQMINQSPMGERPSPFSALGSKGGQIMPPQMGYGMGMRPQGPFMR